MEISENGRCIGYRISDDVSHSGLWTRCLAVGIDSIAPVTGPFSGGTAVTIRGAGYPFGFADNAELKRCGAKPYDLGCLQ